MPIISSFIFYIYPRRCHEFECLGDFIIYMFLYIIISIYIQTKIISKITRKYFNAKP